MKKDFPKRKSVRIRRVSENMLHSNLQKTVRFRQHFNSNSDASVVFGALLSLKTAILVYLDHVKDSKAGQMLG